MSETLYAGSNQKEGTSRRLYIAVDFDDTLFTNEFPKIGEPIPKVINLVKRLHSLGHCIILWTCRSGKPLDEAVGACKRFGIPIDYVNENPECEKAWEADGGLCGRKIFYNTLIDDRAVNMEDADLLDIMGDEQLERMAQHPVRFYKVFNS